MKTSRIAKRPNTSKTTASAPISGKANTTTASVGVNASTAATKSAASIAAAQKRETQRKQLMEMKRKQKLAMATVQPESNDLAVGDGGHGSTNASTSAVTINGDANETDR